MTLYVYLDYDTFLPSTISLRDNFDYKIFPIYFDCNTTNGPQDVRISGSQGVLEAAHYLSEVFQPLLVYGLQVRYLGRAALQVSHGQPEFLRLRRPDNL